MSNYETENNRLLRLMKSSSTCQVQGLFMMMYVENKTMSDVQNETGISRQTLSSWKKGGNVMHVNVQKVADTYGLDVTALYDADIYLNSYIAKKGRGAGSVREVHREYQYLKEALANDTEIQEQ